MKMIFTQLRTICNILEAPNIILPQQPQIERGPKSLRGLHCPHANNLASATPDPAPTREVANLPLHRPHVGAFRLENRFSELAGGPSSSFADSNQRSWETKRVWHFPMIPGEEACYLVRLYFHRITVFISKTAQLIP